MPCRFLSSVLLREMLQSEAVQLFANRTNCIYPTLWGNFSPQIAGIFHASLPNPAHRDVVFGNLAAKSSLLEIGLSVG